ncbi:beta-propeller domain-containing protein [Pseudalkalibacillus sp. Hm43]|uniref:beta-propeller domain-containing protein n=1 Tax=Pseudalkalibacillus sp. Hm43 TaxID=3450742 RepID=UPI003F438157
MKKWWLLAGVMFVTIFTIAVYYTTELKVLNEWEDGGKILLQNKNLDLAFSKELNAHSVTDKSVYVTNEDGEKQAVSIKLNEDNRSISIASPHEGYDSESNYFTLHLTEDIQSVGGRKLDGERIQFVVKDRLPVIGSKQRLQAYFEKSHKNSVHVMEKSSADGESSMEMADNSSSGNSDQSHSTTNIQVQGVDEPDTIKNDGDFIYQLVRNKLHITRAKPADELKLMTTIRFEDMAFSPHQLLLYGNKLIVMGHSYQSETSHEQKSSGSEDSIARTAFHSVQMKVYDVENVSNPILEREVEIEGSYLSARRSQEHVYLISQYHPPVWRTFEKGDEKVELRPRFRDTAMSNKMNVIDYDEIQYFPDTNESHYTTISSINIDKPESPAFHETFLGGGGELFMSKENLYIAVQTNVVNDSEFRRSYTPDTDVYKFTIEDGEIDYKASVTVKGTVLNQFSMDEFEGNFRIATTSGFSGDDRTQSFNHLFIYDEHLNLIGKVEGLAEGERIYSARFMNERIYIVTFKQVDPLFVIDASDPRNPEVKGELKIPGFSNYLHPYDEDHIIGFGHHTKLVNLKGSREPMIQTDGIKISIFNVKDMHDPKEIHTKIIGGSGTYSPLNHDHKALLFEPSKNLFAFPLQMYNEKTGGYLFNGAHVYQITMKDGLKLIEEISHADVSDLYQSPWEQEIHRLIYIDDHLYSFSNNSIVTHEMKTYEQIGAIEIP